MIGLRSDLAPERPIGSAPRLPAGLLRVFELPILAHQSGPVPAIESAATVVAQLPVGPLVDDSHGQLEPECTPA